VIVPLAVLLIPRARASRAGLYAASMLVLIGFAANRMNTVVTGLETWPHTTYFPSWQEIAISLGIAALGFTLFGLAARFFGVIPAGAEAPAEAGAHAGLPLPGQRHFALLALIPTALFVASLYATSVLEESVLAQQAPVRRRRRSTSRAASRRSSSPRRSASTAAREPRDGDVPAPVARRRRGPRSARRATRRASRCSAGKRAGRSRPPG